MIKEINIKYAHYDRVEDLSKQDQDCITQARAIGSQAHAPYSKFHVGACLLMSDGERILGSNQENIAFPSGICAERVALFYAGANFPNKQIEKLFIVAKGDLIDKDALLSPCGGCRQVILESQNRQAKSFEIYLVHQNNTVSVFDSIYDLLPLAFGK